MVRQPIVVVKQVMIFRFSNDDTAQRRETCLYSMLQTQNKQCTNGHLPPSSDLVTTGQLHDPVRVNLVPDPRQPRRVLVAVQLLRSRVKKRIVGVVGEGIAVDAVVDGYLLERLEGLLHAAVPELVVLGKRPREVDVELGMR